MLSCVSLSNVFLYTIIVLFFMKRLLREWKQAANMSKILLNENNWSKATYCYLLATFIFEDNNGIANDEVIQLYK